MCLVLVECAETCSLSLKATELRRTPSAVYNMLKSYANCGLLAAVSCTKVHNVSGNKYKFAQIVQETNTNDHKFGQLLYMLI